MNFEDSRENFFQPAPPPSDGGARPSAGCAAAVSFYLLTPQNIMGLTFVGAAGAAAQSVKTQQQQELHEEGKMRSYS